MNPELQHFHTYFLFPFSINKEVVAAEHQGVWEGRSWMTGLDEWITQHNAQSGKGIDALGHWERAAYTQFDMDSPAYQDMLFFHPFVRRVFFDTQDTTLKNQGELLIRCYRIPLEGKFVWLAGKDPRGNSARLRITDLRLFLFANGIGILSIGVEAKNISVQQALWANEMLRRVYPSSGRQSREGRTCSYIGIELEQEGRTECVASEDFQAGTMVGFHPPLSNIITSLLYFLDYRKREYDPVLDERMIVYSYQALNAGSVPADYPMREEYQMLISRFLFVDQPGPSYRYDADFTRAELRKRLYTRWAHEGTYYGYTNYSSIACCIGESDRGGHVLSEGFLIHRMFDTRYYLMTIIALFYRVTLLDFAEKTALVSKRLYLDRESGSIDQANMELANELRLEFLHFSNYWFFEELSNKDEESEHFRLQTEAYGLTSTKNEVEEEIEKLNATLHDYNQNRSTEAVNRLAAVSMILGAGAVITGFFGMNFGRMFSQIFFEPLPQFELVHDLAIGFVAACSMLAVTLAGHLIASNWSDYKRLIRQKQQKPRSSLKHHDWVEIPKPRAKGAAAGR